MTFRPVLRILLGWMALLAATPAAAQIPLTPDAALARDAAEYARSAGLAPDEALRRLRFQQASGEAVAAIERRFSDRLAGLWFEHSPDFRLIVLLTGTAAVSPDIVAAAGVPVPVVYRTGATATHAELLDAIALHQDEVHAAFPRLRGLGIDPHTGSVVAMLNAADFGDPSATTAQIAAMLGVPTTIRVLDLAAAADFAIEGGARVTGIDTLSRLPSACTAGFVVAGPGGAGIATAAHCPDELSYRDPAGGDPARLAYVDQWGVRYRDVQVNLAPDATAPLFYADAAKTELRTVTDARSRGALRAGDVVCHRGESSGYSCAEIELTDFAPPAPLCAGACDPVWVTVAGPNCRGGDSGGPVFLGSEAIGIVKGGAYDRDRRCHFYFFMSLDYLPDGWTLLTAPAGTALPALAAVRADTSR